MRARSEGVRSNVTRMVLYIFWFLARSGASASKGATDQAERMARLKACPDTNLESESVSTAGDDLPGCFQRVGQTVDVHGGDQDSTGPTSGQQNRAILPRSHSLAGTGEVQQRKHRKRKLHR